uniref:Uncharacterized protein n=1 Tax=Tanacetum cinerariifolium TaxID=118510 RepID=A0A6L2LDS2_TANCI|nr:hypothetical protein [Tanacetum cinerariifolium]
MGSSPDYNQQPSNSFKWRKTIFDMVTSMGIHHAKPYTLRGGPSTKLEQRSASQTHVLHLHQGGEGSRLFKAWQLNNHFKNSSITSKPDRANICIISDAIRGTATIIPITTTMFAATTLENMPMAYHASTLANPNPVISSAFIEANYDPLESLLWDRRRQMRNNDLRIELEYFNKDYDEKREMEPRPEPTKAATPLLRIASPRIHRQGEITIGFKEAQSRGESMIEDYPLPDGLKMPSHIDFYDGKGDPYNFMYLFEGGLRMQKWIMPVAYHMFTYTLKDSARIWWNSQKAGSILNYEDLKAKFRSHFSQQKKFTKTHLGLYKIKQREGKNTQAFITRYTNDTLQILGLHEEQRIYGFVHGLRTRSLVKHLSTDLPSTYKGLMEKTYTWVEAREVATNGVSNNRRDDFKRSKKFSWGNSIGQKDRGRISSYKGQTHKLLSNLVKSPREILDTEKVANTFEQPPRLPGANWSKDKTRYCYFHEDFGHETYQCRELKHQIKEAVKSRQLAHLSHANQDGIGEITFPPLPNVGSSDPIIIKVYISGRQVNRAYLDGGCSCEVIYEHCFLKLKPSIRSLRVDSDTPLVGFSGEQSWTLGEIPLEVTIREGLIAVTKTLKFTIIKSDSPHKLLFGRIAMQQMGIMVSTVYGAIKFHTPRAEQKAKGHHKYCLKCFLDAYKGYHQIPIAEKDEEKTTFFTREGVFCYKRLPFDLKNARATYQKLIDKVFDHQIGRNIEVNADDMAIELGEHEIEFRGRNSIKGKILADFLAETPLTEYRGAKNKEVKRKEPEPENTWKLFTDQASSPDSSEAGLMVANPEGKEYTYALRQLTIKQYLEKMMDQLSGFPSYSIKHIKREQNKKANALNKLASMTFYKLMKEVLVEVIQNKSITEKGFANIVKKEGDNWMTPIQEYMRLGALPDDPQKARKLRIKALLYKMIEEKLYLRSYLSPWLKCVGPMQANNIIKEVHKGSCGMHSCPSASKAKYQEKMGPTWEGPYMIRKAYGDRAYKIETLSGEAIDQTWNGTNLRKFYV